MHVEGIGKIEALQHRVTVIKTDGGFVGTLEGDARFVDAEHGADGAVEQVAPFVVFGPADALALLDLDLLG